MRGGSGNRNLSGRTSVEGVARWKGGKVGAGQAGQRELGLVGGWVREWVSEYVERAVVDIGRSLAYDPAKVQGPEKI